MTLHQAKLHWEEKEKRMMIGYTHVFANGERKEVWVQFYPVKFRGTVHERACYYDGPSLIAAVQPCNMLAWDTRIDEFDSIWPSELHVAALSL
jgi:hypothetical protein